ncbi:hypothetical protein [Streptomyces sp. NPDC046909]|uniref:hypothetical protein n=1 Tax=Streptomyces sp. NPDC046909 TaxID=3155617 RepID=UPI00340C6F6D
MQRKSGRRPGTSGPDVEEALDELYTTLPSAFVARREELAAAARTAGRPDDARRIHAARRPTLAAWAANLLLRSRPEESLKFLQLGQALRDAYSTLDAAGFKDLSAQRRHVITALSRQAAQLAREAGYRLSDTVQLEVESTLRAVLADPDAAALFAAGRLETALTPPSDFPTLTTAANAAAEAPHKPSRPEPAPPTTRTPANEDVARRRRAHQQRLDQAREAAEAAEERLRERRAEHDATQAALTQARDRHDRAQNEVDTVEQRLRRAREDLQQAGQERRQAEEAHQAAAAALGQAEQEARDASEDADRLAQSTPG